MRRNQLAILVAACCLSLAATVQANDGSIAVYLDDAGTQCQGNITGGTPVNGSVWFNLAGATANGITGAEFRVDKSNTNYAVSFTAASPVVIGDPFSMGLNIAFAECQTGTRVKLGTLMIIELVHSEDFVMTVRQRVDPSNYYFMCPLATLCDAPTYTAVCVGAQDSDHWRAVVNPSSGVSGDCQPVPVLQKGWSQIKALYVN